MFSFDAPENIRKPDIFYPLMKCQIFKMNRSQESEGNTGKKRVKDTYSHYKIAHKESYTQPPEVFCKKRCSYTTFKLEQTIMDSWVKLLKIEISRIAFTLDFRN